MHTKKNNNKSMSFTQGLRPLSETIPKKLKKAIKKGGYNFSNIIDNWTKMVGPQISDVCYPSTIRNSKGFNKCTIVLNVVHGKELIVEYEKKNIVDKINSFFGYEFVEKVKLKIIHEKKGYSTYHDKISQDIKRNINNSSKKKINNIENNMLKQSLKDLIRAYENKD